MTGRDGRSQAAPTYAVASLADQVALAEARALHDHQSGACAASEWSCSYCEAEELQP